MQTKASRVRLGGASVASILARAIVACAVLPVASAVQARDGSADGDAAQSTAESGTGDAADAALAADAAVATDAALAADAATAAEPAAAAQEGKPAEPGDANPAVLDQVVVVSARKRNELLVDIPISVTAVSAATMERNSLRSVADVAPYVPGLNINSDSVGRAFVSIRGIGTALQAGVQPGVGVFQDGIYVRETSYVNNPLLDIERIEVLRGPQGTLYGKNTLGGAINIITRQPGREFEGRVYGSYSDGNGAQELAGRVSGPLGETLRAKLSFATLDTDGFFENQLTGEEADALSSDQASLGMVWDATDSARVTFNGYYLDLDGGSTNYGHVPGPTDYVDNIRLNVTGRQDFTYSGANAKVEFPLGAGATNVTAIAAFDERELDGVSDGDFLALDIVRSTAQTDEKTYTGELRFDTTYSDTFSTLIGLYANRETSDGSGTQRVVPLNVVTTSYADREGNTYAIFGTGIWRFAEAWEFSAGLRWDSEDRSQESSRMVSVAPGVVITDPKLELDSSEWLPRVSLTRFYDNGWMGYGSITKGYRGGGFNSASVPPEFLTYDGDSVWTYELGAKFSSADERWLWSNAVYYNDYSDFIGQNALARGPGGGLVSIDLNLGDVESYGLETEFVGRITEIWSLHGSLSLMHARITNQDGWVDLTGNELATDRLLFQPDWTYSLTSDLAFPMGSGEFDWSLSFVGKGSRPGSSFDPVNASILDSYHVVNTALSWRGEALTVGLFANNLFDEDYYESYIDGSLLATLGLLDQNLGILGAPRNVGMRVEYRF